jgi:hypothetical protein
MSNSPDQGDHPKPQEAVPNRETVDAQLRQTEQTLRKSLITSQFLRSDPFHPDRLCTTTTFNIAYSNNRDSLPFPLNQKKVDLQGNGSTIRIGWTSEDGTYNTFSIGGDKQYPSYKHEKGREIENGARVPIRTLTYKEGMLIWDQLEPVAEYRSTGIDQAPIAIQNAWGEGQALLRRVTNSLTHKETGSRVQQLFQRLPFGKKS